MHKILARRNGRITVLMLAAIVVVVAAALWLVRADNNDSSINPGTPHNQSGVPSGGSNDPDPVKQETGPNGDIRPSPTGTGPGSDRSLLGPQQ